MSIVVPKPGSAHCRIFTKGATEVILGKCDRMLGLDGSTAAITPQLRQRIESLLGEFADATLRTIGVAYRDLELPPSHFAQQDEEAALKSPAGGEGAAGGGAGGVDKQGEEEEAHTSGMVLVGIFGIADPLRQEVPRSVEQCGLCATEGARPATRTSAKQRS